MKQYKTDKQIRCYSFQIISIIQSIHKQNKTLTNIHIICARQVSDTPTHTHEMRTKKKEVRKRENEQKGDKERKEMDRNRDTIHRFIYLLIMEINKHLLYRMRDKSAVAVFFSLFFVLFFCCLMTSKLNRYARSWTPICLYLMSIIVASKQKPFSPSDLSQSL